MALTTIISSGSFGYGGFLSLPGQTELRNTHLICGFVRAIKEKSSSHIIKAVASVTLKYYYVSHEYFVKTFSDNRYTQLLRSNDNLTITNRRSNGAQTGYGHITIDSNELIAHEWRFKIKEMENFSYGIKLGMIQFYPNKRLNRQLIHVRENKYCFASNGGAFNENKVGGPHVVFSRSDELSMSLDLTKTEKEKEDYGSLHFSVLNKKSEKYEIKKTYDIKTGKNIQYKMCVILDGGGFDETDQAVTLLDYRQNWRV